MRVAPDCLSVHSRSGAVGLRVLVDGKTILDLAPLYGRVQPFECSWSLDGATLLVNLEKCDAKPWLDLTKPREKDAPDAAPARAPPGACDACKPESSGGAPRRHEH